MCVCTYKCTHSQGRLKKSEVWVQWSMNRYTHTQDRRVKGICGGRIELHTHTKGKWPERRSLYCFMWVSDKPWRQRVRREDRRDGWMDGKRARQEEWRAGGLLCASNNGHTEDVFGAAWWQAKKLPPVTIRTNYRDNSYCISFILNFCFVWVALFAFLCTDV